jgi:DNA polymerase-3 subunit beta
MKDVLLDGINIVQKAVATKTTKPILEGILIECNSTLKMTANDSEICIECKINADILIEGAIVINSKMFGDIVRKLPNAEVLIFLKENDIVYIECENSKFEIKGIPIDGFPEIPIVEKINFFKINQKLLKEMIRQTIFAVSIDENRPNLMGSLIQFIGTEIFIVSIDGFRLALRKYNYKNGESYNFSKVIPGKTLNEVMKILQPIDSEIEVYSSNTQIVFDIGNYKIVSSLVNGEYLNYKNFIPTENEIIVKVNKKEILSSIERASLITSEEKKYPVLFNVYEEKIVLTSNTNLGSVREELNVTGKGNTVNVGFNPKYFIDALKIIDNDEIYLKFTSSSGPCTITPVDLDDFAYMVLPVRTNN